MYSASPSELNTPADWTLLELVARNANGDCSFSSSSVTSPEIDRIQVNWAVDNTSSGRRGEVGLVLNSASYDPKVSGAIQSIDFSINHAYEIISPKARLLIQQAGKYYVSSPHFYATTQTTTGLRADDFSELDLTVVGSTGELYVANSHPDFTEEGAVMVFGIWAFQASSSQTAGSTTMAAFSSGAFSVTLHQPNDTLQPFADYTRVEPEEDVAPISAAGLPNILVIMCDDLGYGDTEITGHPAIKTPNIKSLREEGAYFTNYYSAANICSPSRASMMTGRMPYRLGIYSFIRDAEDFVHLDHSEITIPQVLKKVGYECANIGKWHVSHLDAITPEHLPTMRHYGFNYWLSSDNNLQILNKNGWWRNETKVGTINGYAGTVVSDEIIDWLDNTRDASRPFLLFANYYEPHADSKAPDSLIAKYDSRGAGYDDGPAQYYACVEHVDQQIGRMLAHLDADAGLKENTLVIFTSDHGPNPGSTSRYGTSAPYRGTKYQCWDGSTHVPAIIRWPGRVAANSTITESVGSIDLLQTLAAITGGESYLPTDRPLDGTDFSSLLTGVGDFNRTTPLQWHYYKSSASSLVSGSPQASMRLGDYIIAAWYDNPFSFGNVRWMPIVGNNNGIIEMDYITGTGTQSDKTLSSTQGTYRLYNIASDPHQDTDIYNSDNPAHVAMRDQLIASHQSLRLAAPGWGFRSDATDYSSYTAWRNSHWSGDDASNDLISGADADPDNDGCKNLMEYALATNPKQLDAVSRRYQAGIQRYDVDGLVSFYDGFEFNTSSSVDAQLEGSYSSNLEDWENDPSQFILTNRLRNPDGTYRVFYRMVNPLSANGEDRGFIRLSISP
ncbi:sulfatase-like hydrolase/transferase [Verrucomicrobiaceae bacterium N1E253]|uniref:Sulfatase-like hydrolase/transferase n=1 Tax=Oceaniferula marina TaxID=2748318 RepID=A0A851GFT4_9BACT|nr:sulfatase-like hydrolase/transferase [Oceaniferula marina]NWK54135.1 sulfatase-like hydrolase/transferase [Oceaniferula marina]